MSVGAGKGLPFCLMALALQLLYRLDGRFVRGVGGCGCNPGGGTVGRQTVVILTWAQVVRVAEKVAQVPFVVLPRVGGRRRIPPAAPRGPKVVSLTACRSKEVDGIAEFTVG